MPLLDLKVRNVRNLKEVDINPSSQINILYGPNASGKTRLLESIYLLARGKSFRTQHITSIINNESTTLSISSKIAQADGQRASLGIEHRDGQFRMKAEGTLLKRASDLANYLPLVVIHQDCHQMFSLGPKCRRRFLDWGVFHVEHGFLPAWLRYTRALKQRNAALQQETSSSLSFREAWDEDLCEMAEYIHILRERYLQRFTGVFNAYVDRLFDDGVTITLGYQAGWKTSEDLRSILFQSYPKDKAMCRTQYGPHRADLQARIKGKPAQEVLSRGQQKLLSYAMYLAQADLYRSITGNPCIILADDIGAELDPSRFETLTTLLESLGVQVFLTTTDPHRKAGWRKLEQRMFHVEHGKIKEVI